MGEASTGTGVTAEASSFLGTYERTVDIVHSYLASRVDRATAQDLSQEVFIAGARRSMRGEAVELPWLMAVARNKLVDHWRRQAREQRRLHALASRPAEDDTAPVEHLEAGPAAAALAALNPTYRTALVLRHVDGLSVAQVADHLGRSLEATEQVLSRARTAFRAAYREHDDA